jgi:hypothetical protein
MKRLIFIFGMIGAALCSQAAYAAAPAECFANSAAVFAAHPNASHASYTLRGKRSERCWFADAFKTGAGAKTKAQPAPRPVVAAAARTSAPRPAIAAPAPRQRTMAVAPVMVQFPSGIPPAVQIAVNAQELSRLLPIDETPADFDSRFSVSGYKARK